MCRIAVSGTTAGASERTPRSGAFWGPTPVMPPLSGLNARRQRDARSHALSLCFHTAPLAPARGQASACDEKRARDHRKAVAGRYDSRIALHAVTRDQGGTTFNFKMIRAAALASAAAAALLGAPAAVAQDAARDTVVRGPARQDASTQAPADSAARGDVVVTAERREENLQRCCQSNANSSPQDAGRSLSGAA